MATDFRDGAGGLWTEQAAGSDLDYSFDWTDSLDPGDTIAASAWTGSAGVVVDRASFDGATTTAWVSGGIAGRWYRIANTATTASGRVHVRAFRVLVSGALPIGKSAFGDLGAAVASLRRDRLFGPAQAWMAGVPLSDEYLLERLLAAERETEKRLRTFLRPREVVPAGTPPEEIAALEAAGGSVVVEPGYDHDPRAQINEAWGAIDLRHRPVSAVRGVRYDFSSGLVFDVPPEWLRLDAKYGRLQFVPTQLALAQASLSGAVLSALAGGRTLPLAVKVRYRAGLENAAEDHPDILSLVKRMAVLDTLDDQFFPGQGSSSLDGLAQSWEWDGAKHRAALDDALERAASALRGIRLAVL